MHADIKGALNYMKKKPITFEHRGISLLQKQAKKVLEYGLQKGYETTKQLSDEEVDSVLGWQICYKSNERCKYNCSGLCKDSM